MRKVMKMLHRYQETLVINPEPYTPDQSKNPPYSDIDSRKEWAKYKSYFLTILKKKN